MDKILSITSSSELEALAARMAESAIAGLRGDVAEIKQRPLAETMPASFTPGPFPKATQDIADPVSEAVSDATWNSSDAEDEHWEVSVKRVLQDGTLAAETLTRRAIGVESDDVPILEGDRLLEVRTKDSRRVVVRIGGGSGFDVRGTPALYKVVMLRAYMNDDDSLVPVGTSYESSTMTLYPTWDYPRMR
jgi:hypothetical protein